MRALRARPVPPPTRSSPSNERGGAHTPYERVCGRVGAAPKGAGLRRSQPVGAFVRILLPTEAVTIRVYTRIAACMADPCPPCVSPFEIRRCPPCRGFTPELVSVYTEVKEKHGDAFQLVFVSSDQDEEAFSEYYGEMPWLALPFSERERKGALSSKFGVRGIPSLIVLEAETGKVIGKDCRSAVSQDGAAGFPWADPTVKGALAEYEAKGGKLRRCAGAGDKAGEETTATELVASGKHLLLYFSAAWCGPCKAFTPRLAEYYNKAVADGVPLEVVFVSSDRSAEAQDEYAKSMPWLEIPDWRAPTSRSKARCRGRLAWMASLHWLHCGRTTSLACSPMMGVPT